MWQTTRRMLLTHNGLSCSSYKRDAAGATDTNDYMKMVKLCAECWWTVGYDNTSWFELRLVFDDDLAEAKATRLAAWTEADTEHERHELSHADEVNAQLAKHRRVVPDVRAREAGELAAPAQRQRHATQTRQELVAAVERSSEAHVAASPHTVDRPHALRLAQHLLETHLRPYSTAPSLSSAHVIMSTSRLSITSVSKGRNIRCLRLGTAVIAA